jgi:hypothetical protein
VVPFFIVDHVPLSTCRVDGAVGTFDHSSAYAQWGQLMVELLQTHHGGPVGEIVGVHHLAFFVDNMERAATQLTAAGCREVLHATTERGTAFAFHEARPQLGHLVEIYEPSPGLQRFYTLVRDAATTWDGRDAIRTL